MDYFDLDIGLKILKRNCKDTLQTPSDPVADLTFRNPFEALVFAAYTDSVIPLNENWGLRIQEVGGYVSGDAPEQFYRNLLLVDLTSHPWTSVGWDYSIREVIGVFKDYFSRPKHLMLKKKNEKEIEKTIADIKKHGLELQDYVIYCTEDETLDEPFYNYPAICYFRSRGFLTGYWSPYEGADLVAVKIPDYQRALVNAGFLSGAGGATFLELEGIPAITLSHESKTDLPTKYDMVYVEVECKVNLALGGGQKKGIAQKTKLCSESSEVYAVGPESDLSFLRKKRFSDMFRNTTYSPVPYGGKGPRYYLYPERLGAIVFDEDGKMLVRRPEKEGFKDPDDTVHSYKHMFNLLFLSKLSFRRAMELTRTTSFSGFMIAAMETPFQDILKHLRET